MIPERQVPDVSSTLSTHSDYDREQAWIDSLRRNNPRSFSNTTPRDQAQEVVDLVRSASEGFSKETLRE